MRRFLGIFLCVLVPAVSASAQTLEWDANLDGAAGYVVSYGNQSGVYSSSVDVGNATTFTLPPIDSSLDYYFVVQAYGSDGQRSDYSSELKVAAVTPPGTTVINDLHPSAAYPLLASNPVTWTASASSTRGAVEYAFWLFSQSTGWTQVQAYSQTTTWSWTPSWSDLGPHTLQVWARTVGSSARYEAWVGSDFTVNAQPLQLTASTDFPVPPGQPVTWTAAAAGSSSSVGLEYKLWLFDHSTAAWTVVRDYAAGNQFTWTPTATGTYAVQAWARRVGTIAAYDVYAGSGFFNVTRSVPVETALDPDVTFPSRIGTPITWTARAHGGTAGPLQYAFWRFRAGAGWTKVQDYSSSNTYTWTPTWGDDGQYALQVWVRSADSTAAYEAWSGTPFFEITPASLQLTTSTRFPIPPGTSVTWQAQVSDPDASVEYEFWLYDGGTGTWTIARSYSTTATLAWTPQTTGTYALQVWARRVGSSKAYEVWRGTDMLKVSSSPATVQGLTPSVALPAPAGTSITWTADASGGSARLEYEFWVHDPTAGWLLAQGYSTANSFVWMPMSAGSYALQVWVRSTGSTVPYEAWLGTGVLTIQ
jgi:N-acetylmuramoyl-L-alanine amidase